MALKPLGLCHDHGHRGSVLTDGEGGETQDARHIQAWPEEAFRAHKWG